MHVTYYWGDRGNMTSMPPIEARGTSIWFTWEGKRIAMKPIPPPLKPTKEKMSKFISICNRGEFLVKSKETKQQFALVVKE